MDRQTNTVHGLPFEPFFSDHYHHEFHPYLQPRDDVTRWCQQRLTLERWHVGVFTVNGLYRFFENFNPWWSWKDRNVGSYRRFP